MRSHHPWISAAAIAAAVAVGGTSVAVAAPRKRPAAHHVAKLALVDARKLALARVPGTIKAEELEKEHGRWIYSFEIKATGETKKVIQEVNLDADTGEVVNVETERG